MLAEKQCKGSKKIGHMQGFEKKIIINGSCTIKKSVWTKKNMIFNRKLTQKNSKTNWAKETKSSMIVKTKIGVLVKLQDKNQSKSERKLLKNGFSTNKMQTKNTSFHYFYHFTCICQKKVVPLHAICARTRARYYI